MKKKGKYVKAEPFEYISQLDMWIQQGSMVFMNHKVYAPGWILSMSYQTILRELRARRLFPAVWISEDKE